MSSEAIDLHDYRLITRRAVSLRRLIQINGLDRQYFAHSYTAIMPGMLFWQLKNRNLYDLIVDRRSGRLLAYSLIIPLHESGYRKIVDRELPDNHLSLSDISSCDRPGEAYLYIGSVVMDRRLHAGPAVIHLLEKAYEEKMKFYADNGVRFVSCFADVVSAQGAHLSENLGLSLVKRTAHGSQIFEGPFSPRMRVFGGGVIHNP